MCVCVCVCVCVCHTLSLCGWRGWRGCFGRVYLQGEQEFVDARRQAVLQNAPQVLSSKEAPLDLRQAGGVEAGEKGQQTFVTFGNYLLIIVNNGELTVEGESSFVS